ncbi:MAG: glycine--tRNA ligase subunit beta [Pseudomonadota bacterium]
MIEKNNALIEIFTEELPPKSLKKLGEALAINVRQALFNVDLSCADIHFFSTPRRLAVLIDDLNSCQADRVIEKRGPAVAVAFDENGQPSKACQGFARSCGVTVDELQTVKTDQGERLMYCHQEKGKSVDVLLPAIIEQALSQLPVGRMMRWGDNKESFVRPVHALLMIYGKKVIEAEILGITSDRLTYGHRFHAPEAITINQPGDYEDALQQKYVIADFEKRQQRIQEQTRKLAEQVKGEVVMPDGLLDEVTGLVEYPQALLGKIDANFLNLPREVLISVLQKHQKCFAISNPQGDLLPYFITISNIESTDPRQVIHGNQRVVRARLADAEFFWQQDKQHRLADRVDALKSVLFQKQLGSLYDKTERLMALSQAVAEQIGADMAQTERAARLAKTDLVTAMVGEFPELQGIMGCYYARHDGEAEQVAMALDEQYQPRYADDQLPDTAVGQALSIADRVDTLVGIIGIGKQPSGSSDPYALRRAALGILRMIVEKQLSVDLSSLLLKSIQLYGAHLKNSNVADAVTDFIHERYKQFCLRRDFSADMFAAVNAGNYMDYLDFEKRLQAVKHFYGLPQAADLAEINKRVKNILNKNHIDGKNYTINIDLFEQAVEKQLLERIEEKALLFKHKHDKQFDYTTALQSLADLHGVTDQFFTDVMVMVDDQALQDNRLALLMQLRQLFLQVADIALLQEHT